MRNNKALVLLSGGQDSATCLAVAKARYQNVETICFDYGQRHRIEINQARQLAAEAGVPFFVQKLELLKDLTENALTRDDIAIDHQTGSLPSTFVPGRNLIFLTVAAIYAYPKGIRTLYTGICQTDYSGYPDCREKFVKSLTKTLNLAMETTFTIETPLMSLTKAETVLLMQQMGNLEWYTQSHTCYEGKRPACGICPACKLRLKGFEEAGINDPIAYAL